MVIDGSNPSPQYIAVLPFGKGGMTGRKDGHHTQQHDYYYQEFSMIDLVYIIVLVLAGALIIIQDLAIKQKTRIINRYIELMLRAEPILEAVANAAIKAQEEQQKNKTP